MFHSRSAKHIALRAVLSAMVLALAALSASAQTAPRLVEYSVKFLCGYVPPDQAIGSTAPGVYSTTINIHNPQLEIAGIAESITFQKRAVWALPEGREPLAPSPFRTDTLRPGFAEAVNCDTIRDMLSGVPHPVDVPREGYVTLVVPPTPHGGEHELDVTAVYTIQSGIDAFDPISLEVVPIAPRFLSASVLAPGHGGGLP